MTDDTLDLTKILAELELCRKPRTEAVLIMGNRPLALSETLTDPDERSSIHRRGLAWDLPWGALRVVGEPLAPRDFLALVQVPPPPTFRALVLAPEGPKVGEVVGMSTVWAAIFGAAGKPSISLGFEAEWVHWQPPRPEPLVKKRPQAKPTFNLHRALARRSRW